MAFMSTYFAVECSILLQIDRLSLELPESLEFSRTDLRLFL